MEPDAVDATEATATDATETDDAEWSASFVGALGLELWVEDGLTHGRALLRPEMWGPGTDVPRLGVLATMVDVVVGTRPDGPINPTVDLRVTLLARAPSEGEVFLVCRPIKNGRRLFVGEALLHAGDPDQPFAWSRCTFMNNPMNQVGSMFGPKDDPPARISSFDELLHARLLAPGVVEMDAHPRVSSPGGTIQGGAQALLGEIAAVHALEPRGRYATVDLEIRYLNRVRTESAVATAEILPGDLNGVQVRVPLRETGDDGRIVSLVSTICRVL